MHLATEGGLFLDICVGTPQVPSYATADLLMGPGLPT